MTDQPPTVGSADDAQLLNMVRAGETAAYATLYERHEGAARRLARSLAGSPADVDDVVSETFARVLDVTTRGGGPTDAFRPYLLTALRRVCYDRLRGQQAQVPTEHHEIPDPGAPFIDPALADLEGSLIVRAFLSLPERWIAVLWHTEVEEASPAEVAPLLGLNRNGVAQLRRRAREGLRQAYLQMHVNSIPRPECRPVAEQLGAFVRNALSGRETSVVTEHLSECDDCSAVYAELANLNVALRGSVAPVILGTAAAAYLAGAGHGGAAAAGAHAATAQAAHAKASVALGKAAWLSFLGWLGRASRLRAVAGVRRAGGGARAADGAGATGAGTHALGRVQHAAHPLRWVTAGTAAVVAVSAVTLAITLTSNDTPVNTTSHQRAVTGPSLDPAPAVVASPSTAPSSRVPAIVPIDTTSPARTSVPPGTPAPPNSSQPPAPVPTPGPVRTPTPAPAPAAALAASVSVSGPPPHWTVATVVFTVSDTGNAATGEVTVSITLPAGSTLLGGGGRRGGGGGGGDYYGQGWTCQATTTGGTCQHAAIAAGGTAMDVVYVEITSGSACGQPVEITATSGSASASAESSGDFSC